MRLALALPIAASLAGCGGPAPAAGWVDCAKVPARSGRILDRAGVLSPAAEARFTGELADLERRTGDQVVVVTLPDLRGRTIVETGVTLGRCWEVGQKGLDNGVLLIVARAEHKIRIEVGTGLDNLLKDEVADEIIRTTMTPAFAKGRFDEGTEAGIARIEKVLLSDTRRPQRLPPPART